MPSEYLGNTDIQLCAEEGEAVFSLFEAATAMHMYFRFEDAEEIAEQIKRFAAQMRKSRGQRAYEKVHPDGNWENLLDSERKKWHSIFE